MSKPADLITHISFANNKYKKMSLKTRCQPQTLNQQQPSYQANVNTNCFGYYRDQQSYHFNKHKLV